MTIRIRGIVLSFVCAAALAVAIPYHLALFLHSVEVLHGNDFGKFYYAAMSWRNGQSLYASSPATRITMPNQETHEFLDMNPPLFHLAVWPFLGLTLREAALAWLIINAYAASLSAWIMVHELHWKPRARHLLPWAAAIAVCAATGAISVTGQFVGLLLLVTTLAWQAARRERWEAAGAWLGLLIAVKPFLGLFAPYLLLRRQWRALRVLAGVLAGVGLVSLAVFGWSAHLEWLSALQAVDWTWAPMNGSLYGVLDRSLEASPFFTPITHAPGLIRPLWTVVSAGITAVTLVVARRSVDHAFAAIVLGALLISPLGWVYYLWLALPPCAALWAWRRPFLFKLSLPWLAVPLVVMSSWQPNPWATLTIGSSYAWATLCLWIAVSETTRDSNAPLLRTTRPFGIAYISRP